VLHLFENPVALTYPRYISCAISQRPDRSEIHNQTSSGAAFSRKLNLDADGTYGYGSFTRREGRKTMERSEQVPWVHILTKEAPRNLQKSRLDEINFKLSFEGFGGVQANEETSGLHVVTVRKEGLSEEWLNITQMKEEIYIIENSDKLTVDGVLTLPL